MVVLYLHQRLPAQPDRVLDGVDLWLAPAVEHNIEPEIALQPLGGLVLVRAQGHFANTRAPLDLDEPHVNGRPRVLGMRSSRYQVKPAVLALHALRNTASGRFVGDGRVHGYPLDVVVADHDCDSRLGPLWMR